MSVLSKKYNDCAREIYQEIKSDKTINPTDLSVCILASFLETADSSVDPQERKNAFDSIHRFIAVYSKNISSPAPDFEKIDTILRKHLSTGFLQK